MNKREKFKENATFKRLYQPELSFYSVSDFALKGKWNELAFKKNRPIFLEVGCGKGTYTLGLSARFADRNFIGMDIKGSRIWHGAKKDSWFSHIAVEVPGENTSNEWCEPVTDEEYNKL